MKNNSIFIALANRIKNNGGFTYNAFNDTFPQTGFAVSLINHTEKILNFDKLTQAQICKAIAKFTVSHPVIYFQKDTAPVLYLGAWVNDNILHLEVSKVCRTQKSAISEAQINKQHAYFDLKNSQCIPLKFL